MSGFSVKRRIIAAGLCLVPLLVGPALATAAGTASATAAASAATNAAATATATTHHDVLIDMFVWWNAAYKQKDGFTEAAFSKYFTDDAVLRVNGSDRSKGLSDLASHFRDIQARTEMVEIELPFIDEFTSASGDRIFTHHFVKAREKGQESRERVMS